MVDLSTFPQILVIDDIPSFCTEVKQILSAAGMGVTTVLSPQRAIKEARRKSFDLVITTLVMKQMGGFDVIRGIRSSNNHTPIMMITGHGSEQAAIEATRLGASDYMNKPVEPQELLARVRRILEQHASAQGGASTTVDELITTDPAMRRVQDMIRVVAGTDSRVLITGETGTGKQLIASALHNASPRRREPFIDLNCAAIPDNLLESELFGHEKGAFTGADRQRIGRFEEAGRGTLFLDEIGEMSYSVQSKLLKVLQDGRFNRVGGEKSLHTRARVIVATNRDLEKEVAEGRFRSDLFYRLQVFTISLPTLRQRRGDVPLLAEHFLKRFTAAGMPARRFAPATVTAMINYPWPGNVRELENLVERMAVLSPDREIGTELLPERMLGIHSAPVRAEGTTMLEPFRIARRVFEQEYLESVLRRAGGNMAQAARLAGLDRSQFFRMVTKHRPTTRKASRG